MRGDSSHDAGVNRNILNLVIEINLKSCVKYTLKIESKLSGLYIERKVIQWKNIPLIKIVYKIPTIYKNQKIWVKFLTVSENTLPNLFIITVKKMNSGATYLDDIAREDLAKELVSWLFWRWSGGALKGQNIYMLILQHLMRSRIDTIGYDIAETHNQYRNGNWKHFVP